MATRAGSTATRWKVYRSAVSMKATSGPKMPPTPSQVPRRESGASTTTPSASASGNMNRTRSALLPAP